METKWIILVVILVCALALIIYLIIQNLKDKKDVTEFLNDEHKVDDEKLKDEELD